MADTKITDLAALTAPAIADLFVIVDVSDTSMAASGTDKKITYDDLFAGGLPLTLLFDPDNTVDLGADGGPGRPRDVWVGRHLDVGGHAAIGASAVVDDYGGDVADVLLNISESITSPDADSFGVVGLFVNDVVHAFSALADTKYAIGLEDHVEIAEDVTLGGATDVQINGLTGTASNQADLSTLSGTFQGYALTYNLFNSGQVNSDTGNKFVGIACSVEHASPLSHYLDIYGCLLNLTSDGLNTADLYGHYVDLSNAGSIANTYGVYILTLDNQGTVTGSAYQLWADEITSGGADNYFLWYNSAGVYSVKADGVMAYSNPDFATKYTPGLANYERVVQQWNSDVIEYGPEAGGTGVLRALRFLGDHVQLPNFAELTEMTPPSAPAANKVRLYSDDSGGKTRLMALFPSGAAQQIAIEP